MQADGPKLDGMGALRRTHPCGEIQTALVGEEVVVAGWVHRRRDHGGVIFVDLRDRTGIVQVVFRPRRPPRAHERAGALRSEWVILARGRRRGALAGHRQPQDGDGCRGGERPDAADPQRGHAAAVPDRRGDRRRRAGPPAPPHPRPAPASAAARAARAPRARAIDPLHAEPLRVPRDRDADAGARDARGRARLPRAEPAAARRILCAPAVAADHEAAADGRGLRALLPDRALLPRRGPARRPPARVHPGRPRDVVRRRRGRARRARGRHGARRARRGRRRARDALPADHLQGGDGSLRLRPARHAHPARARRPHGRSLRKAASRPSAAWWTPAAS